MTQTKRDPLLLAGKILTLIMQGILAIAVIGLLVAAVALPFLQGEVQAELVSKYGPDVGAFPLWNVLGLIIVAGAIAVLIYFFFDRLRQMIATVGQGDPFQPRNADRLTAMAWLMLAAQVLFIPIAALAVQLHKWASQFAEGDFRMDGGFDLSGILMVIVLFILARVFRKGAEMREDLEGTV